MAEETQRRLAAIVSADVVGYSRLMGADETGTLALLRAHRSELIDPLIEKYGGRIVKTTGDGMLLEFPSVVAAVECTTVVQEGMAQRNVGIVEDQAIRFRVGVHLGDIIVEGDDIFGDGVNVAARLESLSEPYGLALSDDAYRQVRDRLDIAWQDGGEHEVKNIVRPVHVWRWSPATADDAHVAGSPADRPLPLPDKPSIAVLPFENMSGDPEQEYFSDGITEDIITELSKFRWFFVTARNSSFTYKGTAVDIKRVGRELGVRFVLEGSVRKAGDRVRVSAQLIEAAGGNHIWAERYDRQMADIFELQDEITRTIASAVEPELSGFERETASHKPTNNLNAWDLYQRGVAKLWLTSKSGTEESRDLLTKAIAMDPGFGRAYSHRAYGAYFLVLFLWADDRETMLAEGLADARRAIAIDSRDYFGHHALGKLLTMAGDHTAAIRAMEASLNINPNFALGYLGLASAHLFANEPQKTLDNMDIAIRLSPNDPLMWAFLTYKGCALYYLCRLDDAIEALERSSQFPAANFITFTWLAAIYQEVGRTGEAASMLSRARQLQPDLSIGYLRNVYKTAKVEGLERFYASLAAAGLEE